MNHSTEAHVALQRPDQRATDGENDQMDLNQKPSTREEENAIEDKNDAQRESPELASQTVRESDPDSASKSAMLPPPSQHQDHGSTITEHQTTHSPEEDNGPTEDQELATKDAVIVNSAAVEERHASSSGADSNPPSDSHTNKLEKTQSQAEKMPKTTMVMILSALCMATFLSALDATIVSTALPTISKYFSASESQYAWIGSSYILASAAAAPPWGRISDIFGRKPIMIIANVIFMVGSLICAVSKNVEMLIGGRVVQGIGGGGLLSLVNVCISDLFSMRDRSMVYAVISAIWAIAGAIGPLLGGAFTDYVSWRWCFYINLPADGAALIVLFFFLRIETPKTPLLEGLAAIDWLGCITIAGGTVMFLLGLEYGGADYPWTSATVICLIVFGALTIGLFFLIQAKVAPYPLVPLQLFTSRGTLVPFAVCFTHGFAANSVSYFLPIYFQSVLGASPLMSGVYTLPAVVGITIGAALTSIYIKKTGKFYAVIWSGMALMTLGTGLHIDYPAHADWAKVILYQGVRGIGVGPGYQAPLIALQSQVLPLDQATAISAFSFMRYLSNAIAIALGDVIFQNTISKKLPSVYGQVPGSVVDEIRGSSAGAMAGVVNALPPSEKQPVRQLYTNSMQMMWVFYTVVSGLGMLASFFIVSTKLSKEHEVTKTGLDAQKRGREERLRLRRGSGEKEGAPMELNRDLEAPPSPRPSVSEKTK